MSAGAYALSKYQASYVTTQIHPIRVQPESVAAATTDATPVLNSAPTGAVNNPISAVVSRGKKSRGLIPRSVRLRLSGAAPAGGYAVASVTIIPALTDAFYNACTVGKGVTYLTTTWVVVGRSPEIAK